MSEIEEIQLLWPSKSDEKRFKGSARKKKNVEINVIEDLILSIKPGGHPPLTFENYSNERVYKSQLLKSLPVTRYSGKPSLSKIKALETAGITCTSNYEGRIRNSNKIISQIIVGNSKIKTPNSIVLTQGMDRTQIDNTIKKFFKNHDVLIVQKSYGSQGRTTYLIDSISSIMIHLEYNPELIVKEFIDSKVDGKVSTIGLFHVDSKFEAGAKYFGLDYRSNYSIHKEAEPFMDPPQDLLDICKDVMGALSCYDVCRLDFIQSKDTGEYYFLEANTNPGFGMCDITGVDLPGKIIDFSLRNKLSKEASELKASASLDINMDTNLMPGFKPTGHIIWDQNGSVKHEIIHSKTKEMLFFDSGKYFSHVYPEAIKTPVSK